MILRFFIKYIHLRAMNFENELYDKYGMRPSFYCYLVNEKTNFPAFGENAVFGHKSNFVSPS